MTKLRVSEIGITRTICHKSFYRFLQEMWPVMIPDDPVWNWHIEEICDVIQEGMERVFLEEKRKHDIIINVPPGTTKSTICSIALPAWVWARAPHFLGLFCHHSDELGNRLATKTRNLVMSEEYQAMFPITLSDDTNRKKRFSNTAGGERCYCTVSGTDPTGTHYHYQVVDDPVSPVSKNKSVEIVRANHFCDAVLAQRRKVQNVTLMIMVMQRIHQHDPSGTRLKKRKDRPVKLVCLPATLTDKVRPRRLRKRYKKNKKLLEPNRLPKSVLKEKKSLGSFIYSGQFMQDPVPLGGGLFKTAKVVIENPPTHFDKVVRFWDKAATEDDGCYTVGVKMGVRKVNGLPEFWVLHVKRGQWSSGTRETVIKQVAETDGSVVWIGLEQEPGSGGKDSAQATIRNLSGFKVKAETPTGDKLTRADPFAAQMDAENVRMAPGIWNEFYLEELENASEASPYMDQVDASSGAFKMLNEWRPTAGGIPGL